MTPGQISAPAYLTIKLSGGGREGEYAITLCTISSGLERGRRSSARKVKREWDCGEYDLEVGVREWD